MQFAPRSMEIALAATVGRARNAINVPATMTCTGLSVRSIAIARPTRRKCVIRGPASVFAKLDGPAKIVTGLARCTLTGRVVKSVALARITRNARR